MAIKPIGRRTVLGSAGAASLLPLLSARAGAVAVDPGSLPEALAPGAKHVLSAYIAVGAAEPVTGVAGRGWAAIIGGKVAGMALNGAVQGGRIDWWLDDSSQTVQVTARFGLLCADGRLLEIRDRAVYEGTRLPAGSEPMITAPEIVAQAGELPAIAGLLVGRLDASGFARGFVRLLVFEVS